MEFTPSSNVINVLALVSTGEAPCNDDKTSTEINNNPTAGRDKNMQDILEKPRRRDATDAAQSADNKLLLVDEQKMEDIEKPHHHDVLCGRGVTTNRHPGNESFRALVGVNKEMYVTSTKRQKMAISRSIVEAVRSLDPPGRFLDKDPQTGLWFDVGHKKAVEKTSQALRDGAAMLRKQLSADLGDPDFLNDVFNEESLAERKEEAKKDNKGSGNENYKGKSPEKIKPVKAKSSAIKKGHRRVRSNPSALGAVARIAVRRGQQEDPFEDTGHYAPTNYGMFPPSPHSPGPRVAPPRHARSLPNSPMTWGGGPQPPYGEVHGAYPPHPQHAPYHHHSPSIYSPYGKASNHSTFSRSHTFDYYPNGPSPPDVGPSPRHHSWSPHGIYHPPTYHPHNHQHYHPHQVPTRPVHYPSSPPTGRIPTPPPSSAPSSGPAGHHAYHLKHGPTPEWSPRRVNSHPYYPPFRGEYTPNRAASWTPRMSSPRLHAHHEHHQEYEEDFDDNGGLSVPSLGSEPRSTDCGKFSPKVYLAPRSQPLAVSSADSPPHPPTHMLRHDFSPPNSPIPHKAKSKQDRQLVCSPVKEEKTQEKEEAEPIDEAETKGKTDMVPYPSLTCKSSSSLIPVEESKSDPVVAERESSPVEELQQRDTSEMDSNEDLSEMRASPGLLLSVDDNGNIEATPQDDDGSFTSNDDHRRVEDISMSPISYDREDPISLMDLPENLLSLPISPCGPYDEPMGTSFGPCCAMGK